MQAVSHIAGAARRCGFSILVGLSLPLAAAPTLDTSFGTAGTLTQTFPQAGPWFAAGGRVGSVYAKRDGSIVAYGIYLYTFSGTSSFPVYRDTFVQYGADGVLDTGFGQGGFAATVAPSSTDYTPLLQRDDRIVTVPQLSTGLARLTSDGMPEPGFVTDGAASLSWFSQASWTKFVQQVDGKIVVAGAAYPSLSLARFNSDGTLDLTFNGSGAVIIPLGQGSTNDYSPGLILQPDGKLVISALSQFSSASGTTYGGISLFRYNTNGTPDTTFGNNGRAIATVSNAALGVYGNYTPHGVEMQPDGRLIVHGDENQFSAPTAFTAVLLGFTPAGAVDGTFGVDGVVRFPSDDLSNARNAIVQPDGKLLVSGSIVGNAHRILRLNLDGSPDTTFGNAGAMEVADLTLVNTIALQADGDLLVGGGTSCSVVAYVQYCFALQRYLSGPSAAIEFYNASLNHYFQSMNPQEVTDLDLGVHPGWSRTGQSFSVYGSAAAAAGTATNPVCRFYIPPEHGNSHFFSADPVECAIARAKIGTDPNFSGYVEETPNAFYAGLPDKVTGACPSSMTPVFRLWNQAAASNHRYTTSVAIKNQMVAGGWVAEGYGPNAVDMCAPQ
jgi:uncharacterized delta-60 repeat protein